MRLFPRYPGITTRRDAPGGRTVIMNTYAVIAGLSGLAVFCVAAFKGFGASR